MVLDQVGIPNHTLSEAQERAGNILGKAGAGVQWIDCRRAANASVCGALAAPDRIFLAIVGEDNRYPIGENVLGRSLPGDGRGHGVYARAFYRHIQAKAKQERVDAAQLLGLVVAHELGHLLLGPKAHSPDGIMRANWSRRDMELGAKGQLRFTDRQAPRIRTEVQSRIDDAASCPNQPAVARAVQPAEPGVISALSPRPPARPYDQLTNSLTPAARTTRHDAIQRQARKGDNQAAGVGNRPAHYKVDHLVHGQRKREP